MKYNLTVNPIVTVLKRRNLFSKLTIDPKEDVTANIGSPASFRAEAALCAQRQTIFVCGHHFKCHFLLMIIASSFHIW